MLKTMKINFGKKLYLYYLLQFLTIGGFAQYNLSGKVMDAQGNPLPGASILIKGSYLGTVSDVDGNYSFKHLKQGNYRLSTSYLGYETAHHALNLEKDTKLNITLEVSALMTDEVIVSATRAGRKTPMTQSNLQHQDVEGNNTGQDIPYQLSLTPSIVTSSESGSGIGGGASMRIRGTDASRINITMNGIPLNDSESQGVYWVNMPDFASSVDNIQVQRGVGTSTNGAGAFGASVNFKTEKVHRDPYAEISNVAGSFNTLRNTYKVGTGLIKDKFSFDARYSQLESDGFIDRTFSDHKSLFLSGSYYTEKSLLKFNILHGDQKTGISWWGNPDIEKFGRTYNPAGKYTAFSGPNDTLGHIVYYDNQTDNYIQTHYQLFYSLELNKNLFLNTALHYTRGDGYYEQFKEGESFSEYGLVNPIYGTDTVSRTNMIRRKMMANDFYGGTASLKYTKNKMNVVFGGAWNQYDGDHFGKLLWSKNGGIDKDYQWYFNNGTKTDFNTFAKINYTLTSQLNTYADLQYRHINYELTGHDDDLARLEQEHSFDFFNPKAGLYYTINNNHSAYASFAVANREPSRANFKDANGDPDSYPKPERLFDYELGYTYKTSKATAGVNLYYMDYKDQLVPTGQKSSVGYDIMTNVEKSYRAGIELVVGFRILDNLRWDINLTLSRNRIQNFVSYSSHYDKNWNKEYKGTDLGETHISYSPEVIGASIINYEPIENLNISFVSKYIGKQYFDNTSSEDRKLDEYFINNLRLNYSFETKWVKKVSMFVQINNLFNVEYSNNAYGGNWFEQGSEKTWAYYFPQAGTNFLVGLSLKF